MFFRAFNRINRATTIGRRVSSSSIPIQNPDPKPGPAGVDFVKAAIKWENIPAVLVALGFLAGIEDSNHARFSLAEDSNHARFSLAEDSNHDSIRSRKTMQGWNPHQK